MVMVVGIVSDMDSFWRGFGSDCIGLYCKGIK